MSRATAAKRNRDQDEFDPEHAQLVRRGPARGAPPRMTLRSLRIAAGETQATIAARTRMAQGDVSRIEQRVSLDDSELSTLRRYVEALGAVLELAVTFPETGHRILLSGAPPGRDEERAVAPRRTGRGGARPPRPTREPR